MSKQTDAYDRFTYEDYLKSWETWEPTINAGEYGYWRNGRHIKCHIPKLSPAEVEEHLRELKKATIAFEAAYKANDLAGMDKALANAHPHELVLLI